MSRVDVSGSLDLWSFEKAGDGHPSPTVTHQWQRLRRALGFAFPYRRTVLIIFFVTLVLAALNATEPLVMKYIFDDLSSKKTARVLADGIVVLIGLSLLRELATEGE
ncbi:MAG: hypothetical protein ACREIC_11830 [Limisphaerales bacterium]